jgi:isocitrate dehydrogenase (NAD+)
MNVTLIPGSGAGPQVAEVVRAVVARLGADVQWDEQNELAAAIDSARTTGRVLKGKWSSPVQAGKLPPSVELRKTLGIHTIVRHVANLPGLPARAQGVDITIFREASEDIYAGFEHQSAPGVYETVKVTTRAACERIHRAAFAHAVAQGRKRVTTVHKANILKKADGMFLAVGREVAREFPGVAHDDVIVDALCMQIVRRPQAFDVLVAGNLFGDIVSDVAAGVAGGVTVAGGVAFGDTVRVYESPHGTSAEEVGPDGVNPFPMLGLTVDLLRESGQTAAAARLRAACIGVLQSGRLPADVGGSAGCAELRDAVIAAL